MNLKSCLRHIVLLPIIALIACSCTQQPNCNDEQVISLLRENISNQLKHPRNRILLTQLRNDNIDQAIGRFVNECLVFEMVRPTSISEDLQKCSCETDLTFRVTPDMQKFIERDERAKKMFALVTTVNPQEAFQYSAQITEQDGTQLIVETKFTEELLGLMSIYIMLNSKQE